MNRGAERKRFVFTSRLCDKLDGRAHGFREIFRVVIADGNLH
jgi:hypothetical protein